MNNEVKILFSLYEKHIKGTPAKAIVADVTIFLCQLTNSVSRTLEAVPTTKVHINTRVIKHLYDKKPAEEFDFIVQYLPKIVKYPDCVYKNKDPKRGHFAFLKKIKSDNYLCSLEIAEEEIFVVTAFRVRKENYLKEYELLGSWKGDIPSS